MLEERAQIRLSDVASSSKPSGRSTAIRTCPAPPIRLWETCRASEIRRSRRASSAVVSSTISVRLSQAMQLTIFPTSSQVVPAALSVTSGSTFTCSTKMPAAFVPAVVLLPAALVPAMVLVVVALVPAAVLLHQLCHHCAARSPAPESPRPNGA